MRPAFLGNGGTKIERPPRERSYNAQKDQRKSEPWELEVAPKSLSGMSSEGGR